ncbi:MAG: hypothetical protein CBC16_10705 [Verrucomicrobia bacterium TMED56]|jgi:hypothetical protein|nr:MAG: hypothetical protein CBC16_10705 [Verrucomicrobia bacterium TMED56]|tara:strand:+ start:58 stop:318 length:261 start_codon:yes stop_codon:yes gene_type:complete
MSIVFYTKKIYYSSMNEKEIIKQLTDEIGNLKMVRDNEVNVNAAYKQVIKKLEEQIISLGKINDEYATKIAKLKIQLEKNATSFLD